MKNAQNRKLCTIFSDVHKYYSPVGGGRGLWFKNSRMPYDTMHTINKACLNFWMVTKPIRGHRLHTKPYRFFCKIFLDLSRKHQFFAQDPVQQEQRASSALYDIQQPNKLISVKKKPYKVGQYFTHIPKQNVILLDTHVTFHNSTCS